MFETTSVSIFFSLLSLEAKLLYLFFIEGISKSLTGSLVKIFNQQLSKVKKVFN